MCDILSYVQIPWFEFVTSIIILNNNSNIIIQLYSGIALDFSSSNRTLNQKTRARFVYLLHKVMHEYMLINKIIHTVGGKYFSLTPHHYR